MADLLRSANAEWNGDLRGGKGRVSTQSGAVSDVAYSFTTRFENTPGSNPEELIAAAHAGCFSMAFANILAKAGHNPESIKTTATVVMSPKEGGGFRVSRVRLETTGSVPGIDDAEFQKYAAQAKEGCPISVLLASGLDSIELDARLA